MDLFPNTTIIFQWFLFMTAALALHFGVFRPVLHLLQERRERTQGEKEKGLELQARAERLLVQCEARVLQARKIGSEEREKLLQEGMAIERGIVQEVRQEIQTKIIALRQGCEREYRQASLQLKQYSQTLGQEIAEKILGRGI